MVIGSSAMRKLKTHEGFLSGEGRKKRGGGKSFGSEHYPNWGDWEFAQSRPARHKLKTWEKRQGEGENVNDNTRLQRGGLERAQTKVPLEVSWKGR